MADDLDAKTRRRLKHNAARFSLKAGLLYRKEIDGIYRRCLDDNEGLKILEEFHDSAYGGHFARHFTAQKNTQGRLLVTHTLQRLS